MPRFDNESDLVKQRREEQRIESDNSRWGSESHEWERAEIEEHDQLLRQYKEEQDLGDVRLSEENLRHKAGQEESRSHRIFKNPIYERTYSNKPQASTQPSLSYPSSTRTTGPGAQSTSRTPGYNPKRLMATRLAAASQPQSTSIRNPPLSATVSGPSSSNSKSAERGVSVRIVDLNSKKRVEPSSFSPTAFSSPVSTSSPVEQIVTSILDRQGQQWDILLHTSDPIHWDTIPWPTLSSLRNPEDITLPAIAAYVETFMTIHDGAKDFIQDLMNMWLPDHFEDQFLHRVAERERVQVTNGVLAVFQSLYDLLSRELATRPLYEASKLLKPFQGTIGAVKERVAQKEKELFLREEDLLRREKDVAYQEREVENREQLVKDREESVKDREERVKLKEEELQNARLDHLRAKVIMNLALVFNTEKHYKQLLLCNKADAQVVMDSFQKLLDTNNFHDRTKIIAAMRRLSQETDLFPSRFKLDGPVPTLEDEPVASGSYGDVYKLMYQGQYTCCKVIRVYQRSLAEHMSKIYARESIVWGQLIHPNIVPFYGVSKFRSRVSFISHWAQHGEVGEYLKHNPDANRILLCLDTAYGVGYLHQNDIVHGDLKGVNVLVDGSGRACLGDFGLSSVTDPEIIKWSSQSTIASKGGTTRWQAPELLEPEDVLEKVYNTKASDIYAWAGICYEIFTGQFPFFELLNTAAVRKMIMQGDTPTRPSKDDSVVLKHGLNDHLWNLMMDCWQRQASERPDIAMVLSRLTVDKPADTRPPGDWEGNTSMRFRDVQHEDPSKDMVVFWEELDNLLLRVVPGVSWRPRLIGPPQIRKISTGGALERGPVQNDGT